MQSRIPYVFDTVIESLLNLYCLKYKISGSGLINKLQINDFHTYLIFNTRV